MMPESESFAMLVGRTGDPADSDQRLGLQFRRFEHRVFNGFSLPRVGDVHFAVLGLDDGGVRILAWCALEGEDGFPSFAIIGNGDVEHVAVGWEDNPSCGVVVNDELAAVLKRDGVGAGVGVGQRRGGHFAPRLAPILGFTLSHHALLTAAHHLHAAIGVCQNARLDGAEFLAVIDRADDFPCLAKIPRGLKVHAPTFVLRAGWAKDGAIRQLDRLVFHRANQVPNLVVLAELATVAPGLATVLGGQQHAPPTAGRRTHFIEEH